MSCRRVSRELLERFRFGEELDLRSDPHLEHLQACASCRSEVGLDRALVVQLRSALRARVAGASPSPGSWEVVRERALAVETLGSRLGDAWRWVRLAPAAAAMSLMLFAVVITHDAEEQTFIPEPDWPHVLATASEPDWEMPWWLAARQGPPPARPAHGPLAKAADDVVQVSRNGPFSEFVE